jgi:hypothetical protein
MSALYEKQTAACAVCGKVDLQMHMRHLSIGSEDVSVCKDRRLEGFTADGDNLVFVYPAGMIEKARGQSCELEALARDHDAFTATDIAHAILGLPNPEVF